MHSRHAQRSFWLTAALLVLAVVLAPSLAAAKKKPKVDLCHIAGEGLVRSLNVSQNAQRAHFAHGDFLPLTFYRDSDGDGYGDPANTMVACSVPNGYADNSDDCNDNEPLAWSGAAEIHNDGVDNDCNPATPDSGNDPIGTITEDINRGGNPTGSDRGVESAAVNLVADAQQWATAANGAQIAFMNPGGVRSDLTYAESAGEGDGVVTYGEAFAFQPFGNTLQTLPMTGAQIVSALEEQCQPPGPSRPVLHLGVSDGFTYDLSTTIVADDCTAVTVSNVRLNGVALGPTTTYQVTVNSFLADGGDNFATFATIDPSLRVDGGNDLVALVNYFLTSSPVAPPSTDRVNEN